MNTKENYTIVLEKINSPLLTNVELNYKINLSDFSSTISYDNLSSVHVISVGDVNNLVTTINGFIDILTGILDKLFCLFVADPYTYIETVTDLAFPRVKYFNDTTNTIKVVNSDSTINGEPLSSTKFHLMVQKLDLEPITFVNTINGVGGDINGILLIIINDTSYSYTKSNNGIINLNNILTGSNYLKSINEQSNSLILPTGIEYNGNTITCNTNGVLDLTNFTNSYLNTSNKLFNTLYIENVNENNLNSVINLKYIKEHKNPLKIKSYNLDLDASNVNIDNLSTKINIPLVNDDDFLSYIYGIQDGEYKKIIKYDTDDQGDYSFETNLYKKGIPLTFVLLSGNNNCKLKLTKTNNPINIVLYYSKNFSVYKMLPNDGEIPMDVGDIVSISGAGDHFSLDAENYYSFDIVNATEFACYGNVMSLVNWTSEINRLYQFVNLFKNTNIVKAPLLPALKISNGCYANMFAGCEKLVVPPILPATEIAPSCYYKMFENCKALPQVPLLPASKMAENCYQDMFYYCTSLTIIPYYLLSATTLAPSCYYGMFMACTHLTDSPLLPATTLSNDCYAKMFNGCDKLSALHINADLDSITNDTYTYQWLKRDVNIDIILYNTALWKSLKKRLSKEYYYYSYTNSSLSLRNVVKVARSLLDTPLSFELVQGTSDGAFCFRALQYNFDSKKFKPYQFSKDNTQVTKMNTKFKYYNPTTKQLTGDTKKMDSDGWITQSFQFATSGGYTLTHGSKKTGIGYPFNPTTSSDVGLIFSLKCDYFSKGLSSDKKNVIFWRLCHNRETCKFKIMGNLKSLNGGKDTIKPYLFFSIFSNDTCGTNHFANGFIDAHQLILPSKNLANSCYREMFKDCTGLTAGPSILPATTLADGCYMYMFRGCTSLKNAPCILAKNLAYNSCEFMFYGCSSLTLPPSINNINYTDKHCCHGMFGNCSKINYYQDLNTTSIENTSYCKMFYNCTNMKYPPSINSRFINDSGCSGMFESDKNLTFIPPLLNNTLAPSCYYKMFKDCTGVIGKNVYLPANKLTEKCYQYLFQKVPISGVVVKFTEWPNTTMTTKWLEDVLSTGVFYCYPQLNVVNRGVNTIPLNWVVKKNVKGINLTFRDDILTGNIQLFYLAKK